MSLVYNMIFIYNIDVLILSCECVHAPTASSTRAPVSQSRGAAEANASRSRAVRCGWTLGMLKSARICAPCRRPSCLPRLALSAENQVAAAKDDEEEDLGFERHAPAAPLRLHAVQHHDEAQQVQHVCRQPEDVHRAAPLLKLAHSVTQPACNVIPSTNLARAH